MAAPLAPTCRRRHAVDTLDEATAGDPQPIHRGRIWLHGKLLAIRGGIEAKLLGYLVELAFERVARLGRARPTLATPPRLVGVQPHALHLSPPDLQGPHP